MRFMNTVRGWNYIEVYYSVFKNLYECVEHINKESCKIVIYTLITYDCYEYLDNKIFSDRIAKFVMRYSYLKCDGFQYST